jgi:hypothetical protein
VLTNRAFGVIIKSEINKEDKTMYKLFNKTNKEATTVVKVRDRRDGSTVECNLDDAKNIVLHDWNMEIVEED